MTLLFQLNNQAVDLLVKGQYQKSFDAFQAALGGVNPMLEELLLDEEENGDYEEGTQVRPCLKGPHACLEPAAEASAIRSVQVIDSSKIEVTSFFAAGAARNTSAREEAEQGVEQEEDLIASLCMYDRALLLTSENAYRTPVVLLYNLALMYHVNGFMMVAASTGQESTKMINLLKKAEKLYNNALDAFDCVASSPHLDIQLVLVLIMAVLRNNLGHVKMLQGDYEESRRVFQRLKLVVAGSSSSAAVVFEESTRVTTTSSKNKKNHQHTTTTTSDDDDDKKKNSSKKEEEDYSIFLWNCAILDALHILPKKSSRPSPAA